MNMGGKITPMIINLINQRDEKFKNMFLMQYNSRSKSETTAFILNALGCFGIAGIQRIYLGQTGLGILYLFTLGILFIGTLVDFFKINGMVASKNFEIANEIVAELDMMKSSSKNE
jgi:TM2 domain-containing membrane protein YozV